MTEIETQNDYFLYFIHHDGAYSLTVVLNYVLTASDHSEGLRKASELEDVLDKLVQVEFNVQRDDLITEIIPNEYFDKVTIHEYLIYDLERREDALVTKPQLLGLLKQDYKKYLIRKNRLTFETNAYGVIPVQEVEHL